MGSPDEVTTSGSYLLLVDLESGAEVTFGAAGARRLEPGRYGYVGSARGPEGFARLERHRRVAAAEGEAGHWHVDRLLGHPEATVPGARRYPPAVGECELARAVRGEPVPGVGSTDCRCGTHLFRLDPAAGEAWVGGRRDGP